jgi:WhiB family redox-sensing transcriptional regulator
MSPTGTDHAPAIPDTDPRLPFPHTETPTQCRTHPEWFSHEKTGTKAAAKDIAQAKRACSGCPIVQGCLKWALAHPDLTPVGVWAATTARQRVELRKGLAARLGPDWVAVVAAKDREQQEKQRAARLNPPTVREKCLARLERELIPTRPQPYKPQREPLTPERAARNRRVLERALAARAAA